MTHRIALIGFGTIGQELARTLHERASYSLATLRRQPDAPAVAGIKRLGTLQELFHWQPHLVVEVAGQEAVHQYAARILRAGIPVLVSSVGALADGAYLAHLKSVAAARHTRILVPSGAVAALDYLRAVGTDPEADVHYESRKPVAAWRHELHAAGHDPEQLPSEYILYEGPADAAARRYPQNLNVAATLALAGTGMARTQVRVVADPAVTHNQHTLHVRSAAGTLQAQMVNHPAASNPKTSAVVAQSVASAVDNYLNPLQFI